jgi:hypothetical protein
MAGGSDLNINTVTVVGATLQGEVIRQITQAWEPIYFPSVGHNAPGK